MMTWHDATTTKPPVGERVNIHTPDDDEPFYVAHWDGKRWATWFGATYYIDAKNVASWRAIDPPPKRDKVLELMEAFDAWGSLAAHENAKAALLAYIRELEGKR